MESFTFLNNQSESSDTPLASTDFNDNTDEPSYKLMQNDTDKFSSGFYPWGDYVFGSVLIFTGFISLFGNGLAVHVFRRKGRDITVAEVILLNIAIVNLFLAGASYPAAIISAFSHRWVFGEIGCTVYGAVCFFLGVATITSLTSLAVFRYLRTCYPQKVHFLTSTQTWTRIVFPIYVYSLIWALLPLVGWGGYEVEPFGLSCTLDWSQPDLGGKSYILSASVCCALLPTVLIVGSHVGIMIHIRRTGRLLTNKRSAGRHSQRAETQLLRVSFGVCFGFLVAWLPYTTFSLWSAFGNGDPFPPWITAIPVLLAKSSIAYNPVIYVLSTRRYRLDFTEALVDLISWLMRMNRQQEDEVVVVHTNLQPNELVIINNNVEQQRVGTSQQQEQDIAGFETSIRDDGHQNSVANCFDNRLLTITDDDVTETATNTAEHNVVIVDKDEISRAWTIPLLTDRKLEVDKIQTYPASI